MRPPRCYRSYRRTGPKGHAACAPAPALAWGSGTRSRAMKSRTLILGAVAALAALGPLPSAAAPSDDPTTLYQLNDASNFETGCFGPCACPVLTTSPIRGTFLLHR